ncbi:hypothetical protein AJ78_08923, partial [Emergomyces pasteurianus Ep9510]
LVRDEEDIKYLTEDRMINLKNLMLLRMLKSCYE